MNATVDEPIASSFDRIVPLVESRFRLDGGAMFGIIPKALWQRSNPADEHNRIELVARCWLLETADRLVLVDGGIGNKWSDKQRAHYHLRPHPGGLRGAIRQAGYSPQAVTDVVATHLHFDHVGGLTTLDEAGRVSLTLPQAKHIIQAENWTRANSPSIRDMKSYLPDTIHVFMQEDVDTWLLEGDQTILPGLDVRVVHGHTPGMQLPVVRVGEHTIVLAADLFPTRAHVDLVCTMAYDVQPLVAIDEKERLLDEIIANDWLISFGHDPDAVFARVSRRGSRFVGEPVEIE